MYVNRYYNKNTTDIQRYTVHIVVKCGTICTYVRTTYYTLYYLIEENVGMIQITIMNQGQSMKAYSGYHPCPNIMLIASIEQKISKLTCDSEAT